jgi:hypothetical protein
VPVRVTLTVAVVVNSVRVRRHDLDSNRTHALAHSPVAQVPPIGRRRAIRIETLDRIAIDFARRHRLP